MYSKDDPHSIQKMFNSIARRYDRANALLSLQMHRLWNRQLIKHVLMPPSHQKIDILDLCCGTGDIVLGFLKNRQSASSVSSAYLLDFSSEMLMCAKQKAVRFGLKSPPLLHYLQEDAQAIPLPDKSVDRVTVAYGIRNIQDRALCFSEVHRVLRPGGIFGILELTRPQTKIFGWGHRLYLKTALPLLGHLVTTNEAAYRYLCDSIEAFSTPAELLQQLKHAGFEKFICKSLTGGIATLIYTVVE